MPCHSANHHQSTAYRPQPLEGPSVPQASPAIAGTAPNRHPLRKTSHPKDMVFGPPKHGRLGRAVIYWFASLRDQSFDRAKFSNVLSVTVRPLHHSDGWGSHYQRDRWPRTWEKKNTPSLPPRMSTRSVRFLFIRSYPLAILRSAPSKETRQRLLFRCPPFAGGRRRVHRD